MLKFLANPPTLTSPLLHAWEDGLQRGLSPGLGSWPHPCSLNTHEGAVGDGCPFEVLKTEAGHTWSPAVTPPTHTLCHPTSSPHRRALGHQGLRAVLPVVCVLEGSREEQAHPQSHGMNTPKSCARLGMDLSLPALSLPLRGPDGSFPPPPWLPFLPAPVLIGKISIKADDRNCHSGDTL